MVDTISKILCIVLVFLMLIISPLLISYKMDDAVSRREILLEVTLFIDKVRDTRAITQGELDQFYMACNSHGLSVDVEVRRLVKHVIVDSSGVLNVDYFTNDDPMALTSFNKGDGIQVIITEIGISPARAYMYNVFGAESGPLEFTLAGIVG